jgi:hypothetical protein
MLMHGMVVAAYITGIQARAQEVPGYSGGTGAKGSGIKQRVIAESRYTLNGAGMRTAYDSTRYKYIGTRGSDFIMNYDLGYAHYPYGTSATGNFNDDFGVKADSILLYAYNASANAFQHSGYKSIAYTTGDRISHYEERLYNSMSDNGTRFLYVYDANGYPVIQRTSRWDAISFRWEVQDSTRRIYSASGQIMSDTTYTNTTGTGLLPTRVTSYDYNTQGNLRKLTYHEISGGTTREYASAAYTYNASNSPLSIIYMYNAGGTMVNQSRQTYDYSGTATDYSSVVSDQWDAAGNGWMPSLMNARHFNSLGLADTSVISLWDTVARVWNRESLVALEYNTRNNPTVMWRYANARIPYPTLAQYCYYEDYNTVPAAITGVAKVDAIIYPNPVTDRLNITLSAAAGTRVTLDIMDMAGRRVSSEQLIWQKETEQVAVPHLLPGSYGLRIQTATGSFSQVFIKK